MAWIACVRGWRGQGGCVGLRVLWVKFLRGWRGLKFWRGWRGWCGSINFSVGDVDDVGP